MVTQGLALGNDSIFIVKWESPTWTPQKPIIFQLFSKSLIRAIGISRNVH